MKLNIGCGDTQPEDWVNADCATWAAVERGVRYADLRERLPWADAMFDLVVANHVLSDLTHHELPHALSELARVTKRGGVLRVLVPDLLGAFHAHERGGDAGWEWFPQDERTPSIGARLCTFVTWYGESRSVFTLGYLVELLEANGWPDTARAAVGRSYFTDSTIVELDGDRTTSLVVEGQR